MMDYYDLVLGLIPLTAAGTAVTLAGVGVGFPVAVSVGALLSVGLIGHAMFVRAPTGTAPPDTDAAQPSTGTDANPARSTNAAD
jgi:hypothetical protein